MNDTTIRVPELTAECPLDARAKRTVRMLFLRALGLVCVGLGILGAFLPLLPTTCFFIAAVYCFARSAPAWRRRILDHPRFGPPVRNFLRDRTMSRRAKTLALGAIAANFGLTLLLVDTTPATLAILAAVLAAVSAYIATRPEPVVATLRP